MEIFNKEDIYDNEISPLMRQIIDICNKHEIPMIASFTYENCPDKGEGRCTTLLNSFENRKDDRFKESLRVIKSSDHQTFAIAVGKSSNPNV